jgi:hypothetical protein
MRARSVEKVLIKRVLPAFLAVATATAVFAGTVRASCIATSAAEQRAHADIIFDGVALEGPTATGVQRFRVTRFLKGRGPGIVRVQTGTIRRADGSGMTTSVSLLVKLGQRWRIFARGSAQRVLQTNQCAGSRRR